MGSVRSDPDLVLAAVNTRWQPTSRALSRHRVRSTRDRSDRGETSAVARAVQSGRPMRTARLAFTATAFAALALAGLSGCARRVRVETTPTTVVAQTQAQPQYYQPPPTTILLAQPEQPQLVRAGIIRALTSLGYRTEGEDGQRIVAFYGRGRETVRIQVEYWPTQATVSYLGSTGLRFRPNGTSPHYERWMANLSREIPAHVAALARQQVGYGGQVIIVQQPAVQPAPSTVVVQPAPAPQTATVVVQPAPSATATVQGTVVISP